MTKDIYLLTLYIYIFQNTIIFYKRLLQDFLASEFAFHDDIFSTRILFSLEMKHFKMRVTTKIHAFLMRAYAFHCSTDQVYEKS